LRVAVSSRSRPAAGAAAATGTALAAPATGTALAAPATAATTPVPADTAGHLLRRATFGRTADSAGELQQLGIEAWLDRQLNPAAINDDACEAIVKRLPLVGLDITGVRKAVAAGTLRSGAWDVMQQLGTAAVARAVWSRRQLLRGRRRLLVEPPQRHLPREATSGTAGRTTTARSSCSRARPVRRHAEGQRRAPGDAELPGQPLVDQGEAERELRPRS
jgi:hypothetical protein